MQIDTCSFHLYPDNHEARHDSARLHRRNVNDGKAIRRVLVCTLGLALLHCVLARGEGPRGSVYVPLDSWIYPAFDRLAGLGAINKQFVGLRPWTRIQCAQLVMDADENLLITDGKDGD